MQEHVTERTFYPALMRAIEEVGGSSVQEVSFNSVPDILFDLGELKWILSVKVGAEGRILRQAFIQYLRHKEESGISLGILLLLPDSMRGLPATESAIFTAIRTVPVTALIDAGPAKDELRDRTFIGVMQYIASEVLKRIAAKTPTYYSLPLVISLLQDQVSEMMREIVIPEEKVLRIVTNPHLLMGIGHLQRAQAEAVERFLASYILMSQILFFRLLFAEQPALFDFQPRNVNHATLHSAFQKILDINYGPIYELDVLDIIPEAFLKDTFALIWGLEIERVRHDLPGRIFHELMPAEIRKMLAAFYTRPMAAELLSALVIQDSRDRVLDPACGSGTILVSAYKEKLQRHGAEKKTGNPHKRFCESEIFGADIMPFAVHLTSANLAAMDVSEYINRTQIIQGDSLKLSPGEIRDTGLGQYKLFHTAPIANTTKGESYRVELREVDAILMNPPFTKVERGIRDYVDMDVFQPRCGGEVGLWGHFVGLADIFLKDEGIFGAVIPVNVLRGRESEKVRRILFEDWTPLYVLKPVRNYGFSEWAEYRDILVISRKGKARPGHKVKFCLVKKDLTQLQEHEPARLAETVKRRRSLRTEKLDIDSHGTAEIKSRFRNLMWFCCGVDFSLRDKLVHFHEKIAARMGRLDPGAFLEGYRPVPKRVSQFLFLTRATSASRVEKAFLQFTGETTRAINAHSPLGAAFPIARKSLTPSLRTIVGLECMDISENCDYIAHEPYEGFKKVLSACGFEEPQDFSWGAFWDRMSAELATKLTRTVVARRINPFSPETRLLAFHADHQIAPSNQVNIFREENKERAHAMVAVMNSAVFLSQFFMLKEESTGRYIDVRFYDMYEMDLVPSRRQIRALDLLFQKYKNKSFPCLREQFDMAFDTRYKHFWERKEELQRSFFNDAFEEPVRPSPIRLEYDLDVLEALGIRISKRELLDIYAAFVYEMMITRHLTRD